MADKRIRLLVQAEVSKAVRNLNKLEKETDETKQSASELTSTFKNLFGAAVLGAGARSVIQTASNFESLETSIIQLKGSTEAGQKAFKTFSNIAATTPFKLQNVVEAGVTVEAFGANSEDTLKAITDLAAYMRVDVVDAAGAFGRAFAGGAGAADVLRDRGVLTQIKLKTGFDDLSKMTLPQFREALIDTLTDPDGKIAGSTDVLAETFSGKVSNMEDAVDLLQNAIGVRLIGRLGDMAVSVGDAARNAADFVDNLSGENIEDIKKNITIMGSMATAYTLYTQGALLARTATIGLMKAAKFLIIFEVINTAVINISHNFDLLERKMKETTLAFQENSLKLKIFQANTGAYLKPTHVFTKELDELIASVNKSREELAQSKAVEPFDFQTQSLEKYFELMNGLGDLDLNSENLEQDIEKIKKSLDDLASNTESSNNEINDSNKKTLKEQLTNMAEQGKITKSNAISTIKTKSKESSASYIASIFAGVGFPANFILAGLASVAVDKLFEPLMKFQTGGSFVTKGRTTLPIGNGVVVGDNASGMERIDVTPLPSPTSSGNNITINISAPLVDETVVDHIIPAIRRAEKLNL